MEQAISSVDESSPKGRRDRAILLLLYNTGARVQEVVNLNVGDINYQSIAYVTYKAKVESSELVRYGRVQLPPLTKCSTTGAL